MRLRVLISICLCVGVVSSGAYGLDLRLYHLERIDLPVSKAQQRRHRRVWLNTLRFDGINAEIRLAHSSIDTQGKKEREFGFDPQSLRISWLDEDRLLHLEWGTLPSEGSGAYQGEGHLVLLVQGNSVKEVFRDAFQAYLRVGMGNDELRHLDIAFDAASAVLSVTRTDRGSQWEPGQPVKKWNYTTIWRYRLREGELAFTGGDKYATSDERKCEIKRLARELGKDVKLLDRLNPGFRDTAPCTVRVDDHIGPYEPEMEDGVCIRDNCDSAG